MRRARARARARGARGPARAGAASGEYAAVAAALRGAPRADGASPSGAPGPLAAAGSPGGCCVVALVSHFGDLTPWEYAQDLGARALPALEEGGVELVLAGLGSADAAALFAEQTGFPPGRCYALSSGALYRELGFSRGFAPDLEGVSPYLKLLPMLAGAGSPGTVREVLRGYVGDRDAPEVFPGGGVFDVLGTGYQRPFELASRRLLNMASILPRWGSLAPEEASLLTLQGGTFVFRGGETAFAHRDPGILKRASLDAVLAAALERP